MVQDPTLHLTHITYPEQNYLTHPMQQSLSASAESHYDYSQGFGLEEGLHMPESQREIAREVGDLLPLVSSMRSCLRQDSAGRHRTERLRKPSGVARVCSIHIYPSREKLLTVHDLENRIKELEQRLAVVENNYKALEKAFEEVKSEKEQLRAELADISTEHSSLKGSRISSPASPSDVSRLPSLSRESTDLQYFSGYEEPLPFLETNPST